MNFLLGTKIGMTRIFEEDGRVVPLTLVKSGENVITQIKDLSKDGYSAVQISFGQKKNNKPLAGHFGEKGSFRFSKELRTDNPDQAVGDKLDIGSFSLGDIVKVSSISKSKGFQGGVKRHGFAGMPRTHGHHHVLRHVGSGGQRFPQHTLKGSRGPGRMGGDRITVRGLKVAYIDLENQIIGFKGAIPGRKGTLVEILKLNKK